MARVRQGISKYTDTEVALKRNLYESDHGELTRKDKSARTVDSYNLKVRR